MDENKSLMWNSIYNVAYKLLNVLFPLVSATYIARVLYASGVGSVSYAQNIVSYFTTLAALGLPNYGIREIARVRGDKKLTQKLFSELLLINTVSTLLCLIAYMILIRSVQTFSSNINLFYAVGLAIVFNFINIDWFYQGSEQYAYIAKRSFAIKLISLICMLLFVRTSGDTVIYALVYSLAIGGNNIFNIINLRKYKIKLQFRNLEVKRHLKPIFVLLGSVIAIELYTMLDTTMIGAMCDSESVAYYITPMKVVKLLIAVITAIGGVLLPRLSKYYVEGNLEECNRIVNKVFSIMLFLFLPCEIGIIMVSKLIIPVLFGNSFLPSVLTLQIAALMICTLGFSDLFGTQILITFGNEKKLLICTICGAVSNIIMNSFLILMFKQNGAAIASVISETIVTLMAYFYSRKYISLSLSKRYIFSTFGSALFMGISIWTIMELNINIYVHLVIVILVGALVYGIMNIIFKNPILLDLKDILSRKRMR